MNVKEIKDSLEKLDWLRTTNRDMAIICKAAEKWIKFQRFKDIKTWIELIYNYAEAISILLMASFIGIIMLLGFVKFIEMVF